MNLIDQNFLFIILKVIYFSLQKLRAICATWLAAHPQQLGGVGIIVEIDESLIAKVRDYAKNCSK